MYCRRQVVAMLLDTLIIAGGRDIDALDHANRSALIRACEGGHLEVVKLLLEYDAKVEHAVAKRVSFYDSWRTETRQIAALTEASGKGHLPVVSSSSKLRVARSHRADCRG